MRVLKFILDFYINSSVHVALAVYALTWITLLEFDLDYEEVVLYFVFYATITGYNFVKYFGVAKFRHRHLAGWLKLIQILSFISFLLMCFYAFHLQFKTLVLITFFTALTFFYAIPFVKNEQYTLRSINGVKVYVIALVWTGVTVFIPLINEDYIFNLDIFLTGSQRFLFVLVLMIPFEIRDLKFDDLELKTIPQNMGLRPAKFLGILLLMVFFVLELFKDNMNNTRLAVLFIITILTGVFVILSKTEQGRYYSSFWVEALPIIWLALLIMFT
jgi:hypothetical protein